MVWSMPSRIRAVTTAGSGKRGISSGTRNRAPMTAAKTRNSSTATVSPQMCRVSSDVRGFVRRAGFPQTFRVSSDVQGLRHRTRSGDRLAALVHGVDPGRQRVDLERVTVHNGQIGQLAGLDRAQVGV